MSKPKKNDPNKDNWATPDYIYDPLNEEFKFCFDPCPLHHDLKKWDGLKVEWGKSNFVNPPYSYPLKDKFIEKGFSEWKLGKTVVFCIPACTETISFHKFLYPYAEIRFLKGRVKFKGINTKGVYVTDKCGLTGTMICILRGSHGPSN